VAQRVHSKGDKSKVQKDQYWPSLGDFRNTSYNKTCLLHQKQKKLLGLNHVMALLLKLNIANKVLLKVSAK